MDAEEITKQTAELVKMRAVAADHGVWILLVIGTSLVDSPGTRLSACATLM